MQQNNMTNIQQNSISALSGISTAQQNMMNSLQPSSYMDPGQGNSPNLTAQTGQGNGGDWQEVYQKVKSIAPNSLSRAISDIGLVMSMTDRIAGSAPGNGSRATVGEDLVTMTNCRLQVKNFMTQDGTNGTRKMKLHTSAFETSDLESTATSHIKKPRVEVNHALLEEIREINQQLIDTVVDISDEDVDPSIAVAAVEGGEGIIVKCSFIAVSLIPSLKSQYASARMSPI